MNRRTFVATTVGVGSTLLAGCSGGSGNGGDDDGSSGSGSGTFRLLISDQPAAISDFDSLDVTLSSARVFRAEEDEEVTTGAMTETTAEGSESTADETEDDEDIEDEEDEDEDSEGFVEFDLDSATVDLTEVVGDRAISVLDGELEEGRYSGIELSVASAEGVVDGETVDVMVPSNRLRIVKPFEVAADEELSFVFDINVVKKGPRNGYNLLPVIGKSGVAGMEVEVEEVESGDSDDEDSEDEMGTPGTTETTA
ncbi:DUF4382 domain-containing protein [Salinibaculum salinum]|uniref:DUF4382 domain-containing protein n=1 Tax=Salinibaculum salinum TaxID=3131996 RepID=UPI0030EE82F3